MARNGCDSLHRPPGLSMIVIGLTKGCYDGSRCRGVRNSTVNRSQIDEQAITERRPIGWVGVTHQ